ncbi:MAG TPA: hypothetical protein VFI76_01430 [Terrimicrobiaceae bacterium]|nr:hypothetical protein [Terrimicrobiaceae bacterium]
MMSKKKKDKSDEPKKAKTKSSKKASPDPISATAGAAPVAAGGSTARPKPRTAAAKKRVAFEISATDIALRAYYIAEHRRNLNLSGDELGDWVEAERQLRKESVKKSA